MPYEEQLSRKAQKMKKLFGKYGEVRGILGAANPYGYRNKVTAAFGFRNGRLISGVYEKNSHRIVNIDRCLIQDDRADRIIHVIRDLCVSFKVHSYDEDTGFGVLRHVMVRTAAETGEVLVILVTAGPIFPGGRNFVRALREKCPEVTTVVQSINPSGSSMVLGEREKVLFGPGYIEDLLCGLKFRISTASFYQVNHAQTEKLYAKAMEEAHLTGRESVLDAYCGIGTIGLIAAGSASAVTGVELNPDAVRDARQNAQQNGIQNIRFFEGDAGRFLRELLNAGERPDVIFMDPPRSGSTPEFIRSACAAKPERIVYISCGPESLARDLGEFSRWNYHLTHITPVDLFPLTEEIESVSLIEKR